MKHIDISEENHATLEIIGKRYRENKRVTFDDIVSVLLRDYEPDALKQGMKAAKLNQEIKLIKEGK